MREADKRIDRLFQLAAEDSPTHPHLLLSKTNAVATYADTYQRALRLAAQLSRGGVSRGDRVACLMDNSRELVEFYIACSLCGAVSVALNTLSRPREVERVFNDCTPTAVVVQPAFQALFDNVALSASVRFKAVTGTENVGDWAPFDAQIADDLFTPPDHLTPDEPAILIYSSGTTGQPKGILLSHQGLIDNALRAMEVLDYRQDDRLLTLLPLFSSFGFAFDLLHVALARASVVIMERFNEEQALDLIERYKVTFLAGVPTMFSRMFSPANMHSRDLSSIRMIDVGGGPVSLRLKQMLKEEVGTYVVESYGLTEISPVASVQRVTNEVRSSSCGAPLPSFQVRVVDEQGNDVAHGEAGELLFRSNTFMLGYLNQPELTEQTLRNGWLHSGDIGRVDDNGEIHILDRTKDMIVTNGYNVFPKEVENVIAELAEVQEVAVVGKPDDIRGELVYAFVVSKAGTELTERQVIDYVSEHLARFKVPRGVVFLEELPLTASGKIQRFRLRQLLETALQQR